MDIALIRLAPPTEQPADSRPSPEVVVDILWACSLPEDRLEHIRARSDPQAGLIDLVLFHRVDTTHTAAGLALSLCRRAIQSAPPLRRWSVELVPNHTQNTVFVCGANHDNEHP